jgi:hypothetical protein
MIVGRTIMTRSEKKAPGKGIAGKWQHPTKNDGKIRFNTRDRRVQKRFEARLASITIRF